MNPPQKKSPLTWAQKEIVNFGDFLFLLLVGNNGLAVLANGDFDVTGVNRYHYLLTVDNDLSLARLC